MSTTTTTLCFVLKNSQVLLGLKKRGFGMGRWNGFGGKVYPEESIDEAMKREVKEECGIIVIKPQQVGLLRFQIKKDKLNIECHVFVADDFLDEVVETEEMQPQWFYYNEIPFDKMWLDDRFWFPYMLEKKHFEGDFIFEDENSLVAYKVKKL